VTTVPRQELLVPRHGAAWRAAAVTLVGVAANVVVAVWFGGAASAALADPGPLAEAIRGHRFLPPDAAGPLAACVGLVEAVIAVMGVVGACHRSLRPLGPLAGLAGLTVLTVYLMGVWVFGDSASACGCGGAHETAVPWAVARNAAAWVGMLGAFWVSVPGKRQATRDKRNGRSEVPEAGGEAWGR
jgi:hypothetical protein